MPRILKRTKSSKVIKKEIRCRVAVLGATGVGKTSLITQFLYAKFNNGYQETVDELHRGHFIINDVKCSLEILDTAGHSEFLSMRKLAISSSDAFVLVYSLEDLDSFDEVKKLRDEIIAQRENIPIVIVENKMDKESDISSIEKITLASVVTLDWGLGFVETSAKENINIENIFLELFRISKSTSCMEARLLRRGFSSSSLDTALNYKRNGCVIS